VLTAIVRAFRTPDLRKKLLFTLFIIVIFRIGSQLPTPNVNTEAIREAVESAREGDQSQIYGLVDLFSGGALLQLSVFALGIMPYITASIILQLLTVVIPRLEALKKEGQAGTNKITQYTRYLTIGLAILQATGIVAMAATGNLFQGAAVGDVLYKTDLFSIITMVVVMTAGTSVIMWLGELITDRGIGNGMSILIFTQVVAVCTGGSPTVPCTRARCSKGVPTGTASHRAKVASAVTSSTVVWVNGSRPSLLAET